jgi:predicted DNA-binding transcriptional regulator AlpA
VARARTSLETLARLHDHVRMKRRNVAQKVARPESSPSLLDEGGHLLTTNEVARLLRKTTRALELMRQRGAGPAYYRTGHRSIVYREADIGAWLERCRRISTSDAGVDASRSPTAAAG